MHSLIVDDVRANCRALEALLAPYGACEIAHNGRDAIDLFQSAWKSEEPYDLICLDLVMPDIDGLQALAVLRKIEKSMNLVDGERAKILVITSKDESRPQAENAGCDGYLQKPLNRNDLLEFLEESGLLNTEES